MGDLSAHFSRREFDCKDGTRANPHPALIAGLERLRTVAGNRPVHIVSGFRTVAWNRRVGGVPRSQHLYNRAADIPEGLVTLAQARAVGFSGVGHKNGWATHVDVRPGRFTSWSYD